MVASLNKIHFTASEASAYEFMPYHPLPSHRPDTRPPTLVPALLDSVRPNVESCRDVTSRLAEIIPKNQFWRWKDMWSNSLKTAVFAAVLVEYLSSGQLASHQQVSDQLGSEYLMPLGALDPTRDASAGGIQG